jgi:hypothetical protein
MQKPYSVLKININSARLITVEMLKLELFCMAFLLILFMASLLQCKREFDGLKRLQLFSAYNTASYTMAAGRISSLTKVKNKCLVLQFSPF